MVRCIGFFYLAVAAVRVYMSFTSPEKIAVQSSKIDILFFAVLAALAFMVGFGLARLYRWSLYLFVVYIILDVVSFVVQRASVLNPWILMEVLFFLLIVFSPLCPEGIRKA